MGLGAMLHNKDTHVNAIGFAVFLAMAVVGACLPEIAYRRFYREAPILLSVTFGPLMFLVSIVGAYVTSGRRRITLLLLVLTPVVLLRPIQLLLIILGFAFATGP